MFASNYPYCIEVQPNYTLQLQLTYKPTDLGHLSFAFFVLCVLRSLLNYLTPRWRFDMFVGRMPVVGDTDKY